VTAKAPFDILDELFDNLIKALCVWQFDVPPNDRSRLRVNFDFGGIWSKRHFSLE
jgi:hypothetical protein